MILDNLSCGIIDACLFVRSCYYLLGYRQVRSIVGSSAIYCAFLVGRAFQPDTMAARNDRPT